MTLNLYAGVVLATLVVSFVLSVLARLLNLGHLKERLPSEFDELCDQGTYQRSQEYTRARTRFSMLLGSVELALLLGFWWLGGFALVDRWAREIATALGFGAIVAGVFFVGILVLLQGAALLPFTLYSTFVIEERFGFNRQTLVGFVKDMVKALLVAAVLGTPLLVIVLYLFEQLGDRAWLYGWGCAALFVVGAQFLVPRLVMPLFHDFTPLEEGSLRDRIVDYAQRLEFPLGGVFVIDGSRRSSKSNAFFTGFGRYKRIALFDTLIEQQSERELVAVLAHEVGHYRKRHILIGLLVGVAHLGLMFFLLDIFLSHRGLFEAFGLEHQPIYGGLVFFGLLMSPIDQILMIALNVLSRRNEFEADRFAAQTTGDPESLISALKKLSVDNLSNLTPHPLLVFLEHSHPPVLQRIEALRTVDLKAAVP